MIAIRSDPMTYAKGPSFWFWACFASGGILMLVVRPIKLSDYDALHTCAVESGHGFTSLPVNEELLTNRITRLNTALLNKT